MSFANISFVTSSTAHCSVCNDIGYVGAWKCYRCHGIANFWQSAAATNFDDLEGDLDAEVAATTEPVGFLQASVNMARAQPQMTACPRCRGSGRFHFNNGSMGTCFKCQGTGKVTAPRALKTDAASVKRRAQNSVSREQQRIQRVNAKNEWIAAHRDVIAWMYDKLPSNEFAGSLVRQYETNGRLSTGQVEAVRKGVARAADQANARKLAAPDISGAGFEKLLESFKAARARGLKHPTLKCGEFVFSYASEASKNPGHVYIKLGGNYKGKVTPAGKFFGIREIQLAETAEIMRIGRDPLAAAIAHGRLTGCCAICSRKLVDPKSVERGIGPICAENMGWG